MGLLTASQLSGLRSERPLIAQRWDIFIPDSSGSNPASGDVKTLHNDRANITRVVDAGRRVIEGYNVSMASPGRLTAGHYAITVANEDGLLYPSATGNFWYNDSTTYQADPIECHLVHSIYVYTSSGWSELTMVGYEGKIEEVTFDDDRKQVTIESRALAAVELGYKWTEEDASTADTGLNVLL